tara:strand:+ start:495 stop:812 length:318 start_codon:yes stop_codon:yes gene_type:complete
MKKLLKIFVLLKVIGELLKKQPNQKKQPVIKIKPQAQKTTPAEAPLNIGNFTDDILNANISVKDTNVVISVSGFMNEFDAMCWAKLQSELWLREKEIKTNNTTVH